FFGGAINALCDIGRLFVVGHQHGAAFVVNAIVGVIVANSLDGVARDLNVIHVGGGGDFTRQHEQPGVAQRFGRHAGIWVLSEDGVENGVGNLVSDLVGMTFGH